MQNIFSFIGLFYRALSGGVQVSLDKSVDYKIYVSVAEHILFYRTRFIGRFLVYRSLLTNLSIPSQINISQFVATKQLCRLTFVSPSTYLSCERDMAESQQVPFWCLFSPRMRRSLLRGSVPYIRPF